MIKSENFYSEQTSGVIYHEVKFRYLGIFVGLKTSNLQIIIRPYQIVSLLSVSGWVGFSRLHYQKTNNTFPDIFERSWLIET
jgi:hypothetical protein